LKIELSIIAPLLNEEENVIELYNRIKKTCESCSTSYEIILVDDGSIDNTLQVIEKIAAVDEHIKYISFSRFPLIFFKLIQIVSLLERLMNQFLY
jgi:dolichol-phosphate mannosyltransferase